jgi:hypothetical protein
VTQNVILNLKSPQAIQTDIAFTQGDYGEAKLTIAVKDDEQYITGDTGASISFLRADGNIVTGELSGTQGMYGYTFAGNELETSGKTVATVTIEYDGGRVSTAAFIFTVRYNPAYDKKIPAGPYITALEKIKNQAQTYVEYLSALIEQLQPDIGSAALTKADLVNGYTQTVAGIKAFDAAAAKTLKEIVDGKIDATKIVNNLLSTDASMVLSAALGPIIDQRLTDLLEKYNRLNGDILSASGEVNSIFGEGTTVCTLNLKAGHTYLLIGYNSINISNENIVMSADIAAESGSFATWNLGLTSRTTGSNGGGAYCIVIASCNTDSSVKLVGYGYHDSTYKHRGGLTAVQLR